MKKFIKKNGNFIHQTAIINWDKVIIGKGNIIGPYVVIGNRPQHPKKKSNGIIYIGNKNIFNEYCNIHLPTKLRKKTIIGNNNYFMNSTTVDHDCYIENNIVFSSSVILGGNVHVMKNSNLGIKTIVHQGQTIGSYTMLGMGSIVTKKLNVLPGYIFYGKPAKKIKINKIGLKRHKVTKIILKNEKKRFFKILKRENNE